MSLREIKNIYDTLLEAGELDMILPSATGVWEEDKQKFSDMYNLNQEALNNSYIDLDDVDDFYNMDYE